MPQKKAKIERGVKNMKNKGRPILVYLWFVVTVRPAYHQHTMWDNDRTRTVNEGSERM